ncbi:hypothetical protein KI387_033256 [Taxus chinensis]|uniref:FAD/NAD(P)-binding domain-containing protein n=1 Tax=Taxus chinensis TaxID=29808 RepID=A0AA38C132_TAXCH|nr:hypothetical protein KI387_033256 [Taxus chinensis]
MESRMSADYMKSMKWKVEMLVKWMPVLVYQGQFDLGFAVSVEEWLRSVDWSGMSEFWRTERKVWKVGTVVAGYIRSHSNLTNVVVARAGHEAAVDQRGSCQKKVILLHSGPRLLGFVEEKASRQSLAWMNLHKVQVHFNDLIDLNVLTETTTSGKTIHANCHFVCIGKKLRSSRMKDSAIGGVMDERGHIRVDSNLRVEGITNVFVAGDIINVKELKQGMCARKHAQVVTENIKKLSKDLNKTKLSSYKENPDMALITLERNTTVGQFPFGEFCGPKLQA